MKSISSFRNFLLALVLLDTVLAGAEPSIPAPVASVPPDKSAPVYPLSAFAAIGSAFAEGNHLTELGWNDAQVAAFIDGIRASFQGKSYPFDDTAGKVSADMGRRIQEILAQAQQPKTVQAYDPAHLEPTMKEVRERLGLQKADSGLAYRVEVGHSGPRPRPEDTVIFSCVATAIDGATPLPQLSVKRTRAKLKDLFPGFIEGLQMMTLESTAVFVLPPGLSFGEAEWPQGVERGAPIIFQVTLHEIISAGVLP
jgi:FKBP-type peptidyl-prolyl cis-trans isomerase